MKRHPAVGRCWALPNVARDLTFVLAVLALGLAFGANDAPALDLRTVRNVDASTVNGRIVVTVDPAATGVSVEHRGSVDYDVSVHGDTLVLRGRNRARTCTNCEVSFDVRLPGPAALELRATNGDVSVTGAMERVEAATTNGSVATRATAAAPLLLRTTNGGISVSGAAAAVRARNTNGTIELIGLTVPAGAASSARTTNGTVTVRGLTTAAALEVTGHVSNGGISASLDGFSVTHPSSRSFRAVTAGDGSASLDLSTVNGSLIVRR